VRHWIFRAKTHDHVYISNFLFLARFALRVGASRSKFKVNFPATTGNEDFERYYRAQYVDTNNNF
jgi:hypothetical protein